MINNGSKNAPAIVYNKREITTNNNQRNQIERMEMKKRKNQACQQNRIPA